jgi:hypothetical protein
MTRRIAVAALFAAAIAAVGADVPRATAVVEIMSRGRIYPAPATVYILVAVEPNADNRLLRVEADGDDLYRASEIVLNGSESQRLHTVTFRSLPAGTYTLRAAVMSPTKVRGVSEEEILVTAGVGH